MSSTAYKRYQNANINCHDRMVSRTLSYLSGNNNFCKAEKEETKVKAEEAAVVPVPDYDPIVSQYLKQKHLSFSLTFCSVRIRR